MKSRMSRTLLFLPTRMCAIFLYHGGWKVYFRENDRMTPATVSMTAESRIKGLIQIRDCVRKLIEYQTEDYPEEMIRTEQET